MCPFHCIFWARLFSFSQNSLPLLLSIHSREVFSSTIGLLRPFIFILLCMSPWEKAMAPHSSTLAWKIPWMEEPGGLQSTGSLRVGHDWATSLWLFTFMHWRRKWQPTPVFLPGESQGGGAWWAAVYGVAQSWTRLTWLSSSSYCFTSINLRKLRKWSESKSHYD